MKCKECGEVIELCYRHSEELISQGLCFNCWFWYEKVEKKNDPNIARIDGTHYSIGKPGKSKFFRGFYGDVFMIEFDDGRKVETDNLWCQGDIPKRFRKRLPDNAKFSKEVKDVPKI